MEDNDQGIKNSPPLMQMRSAELMIGDLMLWKKKPAKVVTVTAAEQIRLISVTTEEVSELDFIEKLEDTEPVIMNDRVLTELGFERKRNGEWCYTIDNTDKLYIRYRYDGRCYFYATKSVLAFSFDSQEFHVFQNGLRICGFRELEEKFTTTLIETL